MKLLTILSLLVGLLSLLSWSISPPGTRADGKQDGERDKDAVALLGTWKVAAHDTRGRPASKTFLAQDHQWVFAKDGITMKHKQSVSRKGTFRLDPQKDPKTLDITLEPGLQPGPRAKAPQKERLKCIYSLEGDTLKICYGLAEARPSAFESKAEPATGLVLLRRQPSAKDKPDPAVAPLRIGNGLGFRTMREAKLFRDYWDSLGDDERMVGKVSDHLGLDRMASIIALEVNIAVAQFFDPARTSLDDDLRRYLSGGLQFHTGRLPDDLKGDRPPKAAVLLFLTKKGEHGLITIYGSFIVVELNKQVGVVLGSAAVKGKYKKE